MQRCHDSFNTTFSSYETIYDCHTELESKSQWKRVRVQDLNVLALDKDSPLYGSPGAFAVGTSNDAVEDTANNLGLALKVDGELYPVRETAYKTLLDRAKINGTSLPKLKRDILAQTLNACMQLSKSDALVLVRDEKVSAVHSGDEVDYSVISIGSLLQSLQKELDARFPENEFVTGYSDHAITSAIWSMPKQKTDLMDAYLKILEDNGQKALADKLMPGVRFITSDTGVSSAKITAMFLGGQYPIAIGDCISVDHRHKKGIEDFEKEITLIFAKFSDNIKKLQNMASSYLNYPVSAMIRVCKKLAMPKKAAIEAIEMYRMIYSGKGATAHEVYMAMQEILFILKTQKTPESKLLSVEENLTRALSLNWNEYDIEKEPEY